MLCFRLLHTDQPSEPLAGAVTAMRSGEAPQDLYAVEPASFQQIPNTPFAYWVSERIRRLFVELPALEGNGQVARRGPSTGDDSRRVRCFWEVSSDLVDRDAGWVPLSKGGVFSPFYADIHLLVAWEETRSTFNGFLGRPGRMIEKLEAVDYFFRPGITWPRRTQSGLAFRVLGKGAAFTDKGPVVFVDNDSPALLFTHLAIGTSRAFRGLVEIQMSFGSYEVGVIQRTILPNRTHDSLAGKAYGAYSVKRNADTATLTSHAFHAPALAPGRKPATR